MIRNRPALLLLLTTIFSAPWGCDGRAGGASPAAPTPPRVALETDAAREKLGDDDGLHAAIFYGAELAGSIDDCGCPGHPEGGLPWRFGYTEGFRSRFPDVATLQVDAGHSMADGANASGVLYPDSVTRNDWVVKAFDELGLDAVNASHREALYLSRFLGSEEAWRKAVAERPVLGRFVSANVRPARAGMAALPAYVVRELAGARAGRPARVAFVGVSEPYPTLAARTGLEVRDPAEALAEALPKARAEADLVVVLAYMSADAAGQLAAKVGPQADAFVVSGPQARDAEPTPDAAPRMLFARYQTRKLGELRLFFDGGRLARAVNRYVTLDDQLPKDPVAARMAAEAKEAVKQAQIERFNNPGGQAGGAPDPKAGAGGV